MAIEPAQPGVFADPPTEVDPLGAAALHDDVAPPRTAAEVEQLVRSGLPLAAALARRVARQVGARADVEELESMGREALVEIARDFDPARGPFTAYARSRLKWAMLDGVRRETHGRVFAARANALAAAERVAHGGCLDAPDPSLPESSHALRLRAVIAAQAAAMVTALSAPFADEPSGTGEHPTASAAGSPRAAFTLTPEEAVTRHRQALALRRAVAQLGPRYQEIVERHYFGGERFDHIAQSLGVSKSWLSRLHAQALEKLAEALKQHAPGG